MFWINFHYKIQFDSSLQCFGILFLRVFWNCISWNVCLRGVLGHGQVERACHLFDEMHVRDFKGEAMPSWVVDDDVGLAGRVGQ
jgi:pentatricopeptide repeat protein